jgi:GNAT superfamily N-acetyltransferase
MTPRDNDGEDGSQSEDDFQKLKEDMASDETSRESSSKPSDDDNLSSLGLEFEMHYGMMTTHPHFLQSPDSQAIGRRDEDRNDDDPIECTVYYATEGAEYDMPRDPVAMLDFMAIPNGQVKAALFQNDELMMELGMDSLFTRHGTFKFDIWGSGSPHGGTGVWGRDFGPGPLILIEDMTVSDSLRGKGIGTELFNQTLDWVAETCSYLMLEPGLSSEEIIRVFGKEGFPTGGDERQAEVLSYAQQLTDKSTAFWRKEGFRRVGLSHFWAYATDPNHPSRYLTAEEDSEFDGVNPLYV